MIIRKIGVGSAAKISGLLYACMGFLVGCVFALISLIGAGAIASARTDSGLPAWAGAMFGMGAIVIAPICYGILGVVVGAVTAVIYNVAAGVTGGLEVEVEAETRPGPAL